MALGARLPLLIVGALLLLVFSVLTVEVDAEAIRLRFGIGLVRKRIPLAEVKAWRTVRNPWYTGWGIRLGSGYVLWNVSGFDAVELDLASGRRFRVGTDEPATLASAIERAKGETTSVPSAFREEAGDRGRLVEGLGDRARPGNRSRRGDLLVPAPARPGSR